MRKCSSDCGFHPSVAADDEQAGVDAPDPGEHVLDEAHVTRDVDERDAAARRQVVHANPRSIVRPRRFSSSNRSGSMPVRA